MSAAPAAGLRGRGLRLGSLTTGFARYPALRVVVRRLALAIPLLFVVSALSFLLVSLTPGDAAQQILGPDAPPEAYASLRHELGLDKPLYGQYWQWVSHAVRGDLASSVITGEHVSKTIGDRLPVVQEMILADSETGRRSALDRLLPLPQGDFSLDPPPAARALRPASLQTLTSGQILSQPAGPPPTPRHTGIKALGRALVEDVKHLERIVAGLRKVPGVRDVQRVLKL